MTFCDLRVSLLEYYFVNINTIQYIQFSTFNFSFAVLYVLNEKSCLLGFARFLLLFLSSVEYTTNLSWLLIVSFTDVGYFNSISPENFESLF